MINTHWNKPLFFKTVWNQRFLYADTATVFQTAVPPLSRGHIFQTNGFCTIGYVTLFSATLHRRQMVYSLDMVPTPIF